MRRFLIPAFVITIVFVILIGSLFTLLLIKINDIKDSADHVYVVDFDRHSDEENGAEMIENAESFDYGQLFGITYPNCTFIEMNMEYSARPKPDEGGGFEMWQ